MNLEEECGGCIAVYKEAEARWAWSCFWAWIMTMIVLAVVIAGVVLGTRDG